MNDILLGKLINHGGYSFQQLLSFSFISCTLQSFDEGSGSFVLIPVSQTLGFVCTDSFKCRFVICHIYLNLNSFNTPVLNGVQM